MVMVKKRVRGSYYLLTQIALWLITGCSVSGAALASQNGAGSVKATSLPAVPAAVVAAVTPTPTPKALSTVEGVLGGETFYVSRKGENENGRSWQTAWNELDQIDWRIITPGSTILVDGGNVQMTYESELQIGQSGTAESPITVKLSDAEGRNGQAIFFGGRSVPLPYCGQTEFDNSNVDELLAHGIKTNDHGYVVIDGTKWRGIVIHGYNRNGIRIDRNSVHITVRYVEVYNNGSARQQANGDWYSDHPGVLLGGKDVTFQRVIIHDNGQDAFQALWDQNNLQDFALEQSWLFNGRKHPTINESANYCTHTDGIQIHDGGLISGITINETIIGPGFTQGIILGQAETASGAWADVQNVTIHNSLFSKAADNNILGYRKTKSDNWNIDHVTLHCPQTKGHCLTIDQKNHSVTNTIIQGSRITFTDGLDHYEGNCQWQTSGFQIGLEADPQFANVSATDSLSLDDYTVDPASPCSGAGSSITSVEQLLNLP